MGRNIKFTDEELRKIAKEAINHYTADGLYRNNISARDIARFAAELYPGFEYSDAVKKSVKEELKRYEEIRDSFLQEKNKKLNEIKLYLRTLDKEQIVRNIRSGVTSLEWTMDVILGNINVLLMACQRTQERNEILEKELRMFANNSEGQMSTVLDRLKEKEKKIEELESRIAKYQAEMDELDDKAAREVVAACGMGNVKVERDPRAHVLTYLDISERKQERLKRLRGEYEESK